MASNKTTFVCDDCCFIFSLYAPVRRRGLGSHKPPYCPNCGDNAMVRDHTETARAKKEHKRIIWTDEEKGLLKGYVSRKIPTNQIAMMLGRSFSSVRGQIGRMGLRDDR